VRIWNDSTRAQIVVYSVQSNHIHLILEAEDKKALVEWFAWREMKTVYEGKGKLG